MRRELWTCACAVAALGLFVAGPQARAQGVDDPVNPRLELDGNTQDDGSIGGYDWESTFPAGTPMTASPIQDPAPLTIFTQGGSKDTNDVSQWRHKDGSVPDKDNILQAMAVALTLQSGETAVYFAASRYANNGDAQIGFWFFQQEVAPQTDGTFGPSLGTLANHTDGDLLVLVNFEGGGLTPTMQVYKWEGGLTGGPVLVDPSLLTTGQCGAGANAGLHDACAITNAGNSDAPASWLYTPKSGDANVFPAQSFFEGGVNLNAIFGGNVPCFSSFLAETRSASSITAQLKDFAEGSFDLCKITVTKTCGAGVITLGGTAIEYTYGGTVTNNGAGTVYDVEVVDTPGATGTQTPANDITVASSLAPGASANWSAKFVTTSLGFTNAATAKAASTSGGAQTVTDTTTASCAATASSGISITKLCSPGTSLVDVGSTVVVQVGVSGQVCNEGGTKLTGVALSHDPTTTVTLGATALNPKGQAGDCASWSASYNPSSISSGNGSIPGRYFFDDKVTVTAATPALGSALPAAAGCSGGLACAGASCPICPGGACVVPAP